MQNIDVNLKKEQDINFFVDDTEEPVALLGSDYLQSFLGGQGINQGFAVATQKRIYFKGKYYAQNLQGKWRKVMTEKTLDLKDITGTGYTTSRNTQELILGIIFTVNFLFFAYLIYLSDVKGSRAAGDFLETVLLFNVSEGIASLLLFSIFGLGITGFILLMLYIFRKHTIFTIEFAGGIGNISFKTSWFDKEEIDAFQKKLRQAKEAEEVNRGKNPVVAENYSADKEKPKIENNTTLKNSKLNGVADELKKYGDLLAQKMITQDEFDEIKKELLFKNNKAEM